jgi:alpha-tubulin suppressor-like RCC1 family protein
VGDGTTSGRYTPVDVTGLASSAVAVTCGRYHTCALLDTGAVQCWGRNDVGQLGNGLSTDSSIPVNVTGLSSGVTALSAGHFYHTCALLDSGGVRCWGENVSGQLGDGTTTNRPTPVDVSGLASGVISVSSGGYHSCTALAGGNMMCWGLNDSGQLGNGTTAGSTLPVNIGSPCP